MLNVIIYFLAEMLTGMVPEMEFDDFVLGESNAIISFLAKEFGLAGKGNRDEARCVMIADLISDFIQKGRPVRFDTRRRMSASWRGCCGT